MIILKLIICFLVLIVMPTSLGLLFTRFMKQKNNLLLAFVIGYLCEFAILELLAVPMIFLKLKFTTLMYLWISVVLICTSVSLVKNLKKIDIKEILDKLKKIKDKSNIICILPIILIGIQIIISIAYTHIDQDDAFYVGTATTTIAENSMYIVAAEDGTMYGKLPSRYVLSPFPLYTAIISCILDIKPAIVAHTIFAPLFILLAYTIYTLIAQKLFENDKKDISIFLTLLSVLYVFGNYAIFTNFSFLLFRIWQGKAILANIILPSIWLIFLNCIEENKLINWFVLFITMLAGCFVTEMGIALAPITLFLLAICFAIKYKKIGYLLKSMICMIPSVICFIIFLIIK